MTTGKEKPAKKSPPTKKSDRKSDSKSNKNKKSDSIGSPLAIAFYNNLLKICYAIAIFDLVHALYFAIQAMILLVRSFNTYSIFALLGTIFWVLIVVLLIVGLWKRRPTLVRVWLVFSLVGFVVDLIFLIWGIGASITVDWDHLQEFTIIFIGIIIEVSCIYLVYRYYTLMDPCRMVDVPEEGQSKPRKKRPLDENACNESRKSSGTNKKSDNARDKKKDKDKDKDKNKDKGKDKDKKKKEKK